MSGQQNNPQGEKAGNENKYDVASQESRASTKKLKKGIVAAFALMIAFILIYFVVSAIVDSIKDSDSGADPRETQEIVFAAPDYEYDIMKDPAYIELDRSIYLCDANTGVTVSIDENDIKTQDPAFQTLYKMIQCAIRGDVSGYNELFSENYYSVEMNVPKEEFTMQQIYDIVFTKIRVSDQKENGVLYEQYEYEVKYRIRENNGTFRNDFDGEGWKPQYFVLSDRETVNRGGDVLIERVLGYVEK